VQPIVERAGFFVCWIAATIVAIGCGNGSTEQPPVAHSTSSGPTSSTSSGSSSSGLAGGPPTFLQWARRLLQGTRQDVGIGPVAQRMPVSP